MKLTIDDEKLQKLHWTHLKKVVEANGAHYDGFTKDEAELYVMEQTEFTEAALELLNKYGLTAVGVPSDAKVESEAQLETTSEPKPETNVNDAPAPETDYPEVTDTPAVEDDAEAESEDEATAETDAIPVFDHNLPHGKISGLCAARFYQNGHHFAGDFRFIPASEIE